MGILRQTLSNSYSLWAEHGFLDTARLMEHTQTYARDYALTLSTKVFILKRLIKCAQRRVTQEQVPLILLLTVAVSHKMAVNTHM